MEPSDNVSRDQTVSEVLNPKVSIEAARLQMQLPALGGEGPRAGSTVSTCQLVGADESPMVYVLKIEI